MKLNGTYTFKASSAQVFDAILNPEVLKSAIPGCNGVEYTSPDQMVVEVTTPLPGLKGPFRVNVDIVDKQAPSTLGLQVRLKGKGSSLSADSKITLADEGDGTLLTYDAKADLEGMIAVADNPIGQPVVKKSLNSFFKNLEKALEASPV